MNPATKITELPALTVDLLKANGVLIDNVFASLWRQLGMKTLLSRAGFNKRSGTPIHEVIYGLLLWLWLKQKSIGLFARESLQGAMGKDVLYDTINREDLNWRKYHELLASQTVKTFKSPGKKAFVVDDSIAQRFGKKMPGISSHFDHTTGRHVMGQQVLTLGLSCDEGFVPLDSELFISQTKAQGLNQPFEDGRSTVAKRYRTAQQDTKPEMVKAMVKRALSAGIMCAKPGKKRQDNNTRLKTSMPNSTWRRKVNLNSGLRYVYCLYAATMRLLKVRSASMIGLYS
jgi:hypothetical protein